MPKFIDETGNTYGKWTVVKKVENPQKNGALFLCKCECGHEQNILGKRLRAGETQKCVRCAADARIKSYAGHKFNKLLVLDEYESRKNGVYWHCKCDCGNDTWVSTGNLISGEVKSCGCLSHQCTRKLEDLTNQTFYDLTVIGLHNYSDGHRNWKCKCNCGNTTIVKTSDLTTGKVKSCGCRKVSPINAGDTFGKLTIIEPLIKRSSSGSIIFSCKCDCGNICEVPSTNLIRGDWKSCGCGRYISYGERDIAAVLEQSNVQYERNKRFEDFTPLFRKARQTIGGRPPEYDFAVYDTQNNIYIIEYDGIQHFKIQKTGWATEDRVLNVHQSDLLKNQYCFEHNIPLIRIPYDAAYTTEDLFLETTRFLLTPENEEEYYSQRSNYNAI